MHLHILGICGTFMAGLARLAVEAGHRVTGADRAAWPPMSTQLAELGIPIHTGYDAGSLHPRPDLVVVGNALTRGLPVIEAMLDARLAHVSGPAWLHDEILGGRDVLAVAGTHGKTTTSAMLVHMLECAGLAPGFLIGGVPGNFPVSARSGGNGRPFVVEADEYDTAYFDKRAKFVHYPATTAVLNNLEHDHADIYPDVAAIERQFHHFVRIVPGNGHIIAPVGDVHVDNALALGCWTPIVRFGNGGDWSAHPAAADGSRFQVLHDGRQVAEVQWPMFGDHNVRNALAAIAAAATVGVSPATSAAALATFCAPARRQQLHGTAQGTRLYLDFAHHPTAILETLNALRARHGGRIVAVVEPRSNTMRAGTHLGALTRALGRADLCWLLAEPGLEWNPAVLFANEPHITVSNSIEALVAGLTPRVTPDDTVVVMSNGDSTRIADPLLIALEESAP